MAGWRQVLLCILSCMLNHSLITQRVISVLYLSILTHSRPIHVWYSVCPRPTQSHACPIHTPGMLHPSSTYPLIVRLMTYSIYYVNSIFTKMLSDVRFVIKNECSLCVLLVCMLCAWSVNGRSRLRTGCDGGFIVHTPGTKNVIYASYGSENHACMSRA